MPNLRSIPAPLSLVAELTHRCPLHCVYCSNPLQLKTEELSTADWLRVLDQAHSLGVVQLHLSGGEPLLRHDLEEIIACGRELEFYTNLITSGVGLTLDRAQALATSGLDSVQLSVQAGEAGLSDRIGGRKAFAEKKRAAATIREAGLPLSMNVVLHRLNLDQIEEIIDLCVAWGSERLELANSQYHGWALVNRDKLLPTREQLSRAQAIYERKKPLLHGTMELIWVLPDYYESFPKPCMGGWGGVHLSVAPDGTVLPCQAAGSIRTLRFENVRKSDLGWIWRESPSFNAFRGFDWMTGPCRNCDRRFQDFGGCRCQAFALTGHAERTDPVCQWSPDHYLVEFALADAGSPSAAVNGSDFKAMTHRPDPARKSAAAGTGPVV
jgi:PqqA peptide cyclase